MCVGDEDLSCKRINTFITIIWTQSCLLLSDDVCLKEIATTLSKSHILPDLPVNFDSYKKEPPCFHRTISIQIDSPLPQDETQAISRQSDVELHNKSSPNLIFHVFCLNLDGFKNKTPCFHRTISIQIDSPLPQDDIQAVSRRSDVVLHNKSSPKLTLYLICL